MRKTILIVDDEELNRELLKQMFENEYEIVMATNGREAVVKFSQYKDELAVVLLDLLMPVMDGYQVLQILDGNDSMKYVPIVLITAKKDMETALKCYSLGVVDIINKPFMAKVVKQRVTNAIEMYQSREQLERLLGTGNK